MHDIVDIRKSAILFLEIFQFATEKFCKFYSFQAQNGNTVYILLLLCFLILDSLQHVSFSGNSCNLDRADPSVLGKMDKKSTINRKIRHNRCKHFLLRPSFLKFLIFAFQNYYLLFYLPFYLLPIPFPLILFLKCPPPHF